MSILKYRLRVKDFFSSCCNSRFTAKSNGLFTYYVCNDCGKKTEAVDGKGKELDLYGRIRTKKKC